LEFFPEQTNCQHPYLSAPFVKIRVEAYKKSQETHIVRAFTELLSSSLKEYFTAPSTTQDAINSLSKHLKIFCGTYMVLQQGNRMVEQDFTPWLCKHVFMEESVHKFELYLQISLIERLLKKYTGPLLTSAFAN